MQTTDEVEAEAEYSSLNNARVAARKTLPAPSGRQSSQASPLIHRTSSSWNLLSSFLLSIVLHILYLDHIWSVYASCQRNNVHSIADIARSLLAFPLYFTLTLYQRHGDLYSHLTYLPDTKTYVNRMHRYCKKDNSDIFHVQVAPTTCTPTL